MSRHSVSRCSTLWISDVQCFDARCPMLDLLGWCNHKQIDPTPTDPSAKSRLCYQYLIVLLWSGFSKYLISCFFLPSERVRSSQGSVRSADVTKEVWKKRSRPGYHLTTHSPRRWIQIVGTDPLYYLWCMIRKKWLFEGMRIMAISIYIMPASIIISIRRKRWKLIIPS